MESPDKVAYCVVCEAVLKEEEREIDAEVVWEGDEPGESILEKLVGGFAH